MKQFVILGRGGQGAQTAGNQLARAFFAEGKFVQTFATYGGARRGTPVSVSLRVSDRPIRLRSNVNRADAMLCFDDSLLDGVFLGLAGAGSVVVVNSQKDASAFKGPDGVRILPLDGRGIALATGMGKVVNSALIGGFAAVLNAPDIAVLQKVIRETAPAKKAENVAALRKAFAALGDREKELCND